MAEFKGVTLAGDLVVGAFTIKSLANGDISITPNGSGNLILDGLKWPQVDGAADEVLKSNGSAQLSWVAQGSLSVTAGITASTTRTQGNGPLTSQVNEISVCANANDTVTLPTAAAGKECLILNNGAETAQIFPAEDDNLGKGVDTSTTLAKDVSVKFVAYDAINWFSRG